MRFVSLDLLRRREGTLNSKAFHPDVTLTSTWGSETTLGDMHCEAEDMHDVSVASNAKGESHEIIEKVDVLYKEFKVFQEHLKELIVLYKNHHSSMKTLNETRFDRANKLNTIFGNSPIASAVVKGSFSPSATFHKELLSSPSSLLSTLGDDEVEYSKSVKDQHVDKANLIPEGTDAGAEEEVLLSVHPPSYSLDDRPADVNVHANCPKAEAQGGHSYTADVDDGLYLNVDDEDDYFQTFDGGAQVERNIVADLVVTKEPNGGKIEHLASVVYSVAPVSQGSDPSGDKGYSVAEVIFCESTGHTSVETEPVVKERSSSLPSVHPPSHPQDDPPTDVEVVVNYHNDKIQDRYTPSADVGNDVYVIVEDEDDEFESNIGRGCGVVDVVARLLSRLFGFEPRSVMCFKVRAAVEPDGETKELLASGDRGGDNEDTAAEEICCESTGPKSKEAKATQEKSGERNSINFDSSDETKLRAIDDVNDVGNDDSEEPEASVDSQPGENGVVLSQEIVNLGPSQMVDALTNGTSVKQTYDVASNMEADVVAGSRLTLSCFDINEASMVYSILPETDGSDLLGDHEHTNAIEICCETTGPTSKDEEPAGEKAITSNSFHVNGAISTVIADDKDVDDNFDVSEIEEAADCQADEHDDAQPQEISNPDPNVMSYDLVEEAIVEQAPAASDAEADGDAIIEPQVSSGAPSGTDPKLSYFDIHEDSYIETKKYLDLHDNLVKYIEDWDLVLFQRVHALYTKYMKHRKDLQHYMKKMDYLNTEMSKLQKIVEEKEKPLSLKKVERLDRNVVKLALARSMHDTSGKSLCLFLDEIVNRSWRDVFPMLQRAVNFEQDYVAMQAEIFGRLKGTAELLELIATGHEESLLLIVSSTESNQS